MRGTLLAFVVLAACGGDDAGTPDPNAPPPAAAPPAAKLDPSKQLQPRMHAEDNVICPVPEKPTGPTCRPETPTCEPGLYCLPTPAGNHCEVCPERDSIRHEFKDRDFASDQARDPFLSPDLASGGGGGERQKPKDLGPCRRDDQLIASTFSVRELKLVGISRQGTKRKVLMVDPANRGHSIQRSDCVGKEKALVQDIGTGYIKFQINPEEPDRGPQRPVEDYSVELHANDDLLQSSQPSAAPTPTASAPVVQPPTTTGPAPVVPAPAAVVPPPAQKP
jgi:Tfp pilus assembly protein PilP